MTSRNHGSRLGTKLMQQQLAEAHAAAASTTRCWTLVKRLGRRRGRAGGADESG